MSEIVFYATEKDTEKIVSYINGQEDLAYIVSNGQGRWIAKKSLELKELERQRSYLLWHIPSGPLTIPVTFQPDVVHDLSGTKAAVSFSAPGSLLEFGISGYVARPMIGDFVDINAGSTATTHHIAGMSRRCTRFHVEAIVRNPFLGWKEILGWEGGRFREFDADIQLFSLSFGTSKNIKNIPLSHFYWIENHWRVIGRPAKSITKKCWESLRRWVKKETISVTRGGPNYVNEYSCKLKAFVFPGAQEEFKQGTVGDIN